MSCEVDFLLLLDIPRMRWDATQLVYHALGRLGIEALVLTRTIEPYVCVGFSQGISAEVDIEYCRRNRIGVFRREIGGGTVFIDRNQLLVQLVLRRDNPAVPAGQNNFFRKFLSPILEVYRGLGLEAELRPPCDVLVKGRKISGTGGGEVGECAVLATNLLVDFNIDRMTRVLRCPGLKFRRALRNSLERNITTLRAELGTPPPWSVLRRLVREGYANLLGALEEPGSAPPLAPGGTGTERRKYRGGGRMRGAIPFYQIRRRKSGEGDGAAGGSPLTKAIAEEMERVRMELFSKKWLGDQGAKKSFREVKVRELNYLVQLDCAGTGLLLEVVEGRIASVKNLRRAGPEGWWSGLVGLDYCPEEIINIATRIAGNGSGG
ncbi:MAG: hypothetical protein QXH42_04665 [Thermoplasmata archaeon]